MRLCCVVLCCLGLVKYNELFCFFIVNTFQDVVQTFGVFFLGRDGFAIFV